MHRRAAFTTLVLAPALALGLTSSRAAPPDALDDLMGRLAAIPGLQATFTEERRFALLDSPLRSEGTIHYAPGPRPRFARHVTAPAASTVLLAGDQLVFGDGDGQEELDLGSRPAVRPFVETFTAVLRGDRAALERIHRVTLETTDGGGWRIVLRPRVSPMDRVISRFEVEGKDVVLTRMLLVESGGDETETTFTCVDAAHRYDAAEAERVFRVPGPGR